MGAYRLVLAAVLGTGALATPATADAAKKIMVAECGVGGCRCMLSSMTLDGMELLTGAPSPPGAEGMTLVVGFDQMQWSAKTPKEIHGYFGGAGACPIELFPSAGDGPRDGTWEFHNSAVDMTGCPAAAGFNSSQAAVQRKHIDWQGSFDPRRYWPPEMHWLVKWTRMDDSNWRGKVSIPMTDSETILRVQLVNPVTIRGWNELTTSGDLPALKCFSMQSDFTARWIAEE